MTHDEHNHGRLSLGLLTPSTPAHIDPVCGMTVDPATAAASVDHDGRRFSFCCQGCADAFRAEPGRYLGPPAGTPVQLRTKPR